MNLDYYDREYWENLAELKLRGNYDFSFWSKREVKRRRERLGRFFYERENDYWKSMKENTTASLEGNRPLRLYGPEREIAQSLGFDVSDS